MSLIREIYESIVHHPERKMTVDEIIERVGQKVEGVNPHTVRVNVSKMAAKGLLLEKTEERVGHAKIYQKRMDIEDQWAQMTSDRSSADEPDSQQDGESPAQLKRKSRSRPVLSNSYDAAGKVVTQFLRDMKDLQLYFQKIEDVDQRLNQIEKLLKQHSDVLTEIKTTKPSVVVRKERRQVKK